MKTLGSYIEEVAMRPPYRQWHLASDGELEKKPTIDHTITAIPKELRGGYTGLRASDVLNLFPRHDGYVFDENNNRIDLGYRATVSRIWRWNSLTSDGQKPFFDDFHIDRIIRTTTNYEGPVGSKENTIRSACGLAALGGDYKEEYPDYLARARRWIESGR
ncbi:MAG: hypothetical protein ACLUI3_03550 [Christensenellales bacterium]